MCPEMGKFQIQYAASAQLTLWRKLVNSKGQAMAAEAISSPVISLPHLLCRPEEINIQHQGIRSELLKSSQTELDSKDKIRVTLGKITLHLICTLSQLLLRLSATAPHTPWRVPQHLAEHSHPPNSLAPDQGLHPVSSGKTSNSKTKTL